MNIHFFPKGDWTVPSSRLRVLYLAQELRRLKVDTVIHRAPTQFEAGEISLTRLSEFTHHFLDLVRLPHDAVIFSQRTIYQPEFVLLLLIFKKLFKRRLIFDIDDAVYIHTPRLTNLMLQTADVVLAGGRQVERYCRKFNNHVYFFRTAIPLRLYRKKVTYTVKKKLIVGWIGDVRAHQENLKFLVSVLRELVTEKMNFTFRLIGALKDQSIHSMITKIKGLHSEVIDEIEWQKPEAVSKAIRAFDIGVMPLTDTTFNRAKYFKLFEYMACGVPAVVSNLGEATYIIQHGKNGFLADTQADWVENITNLVHSRHLREKIGKKGRETIVKRYSTQQVAKTLSKIIEELNAKTK